MPKNLLSLYVLPFFLACSAVFAQEPAESRIGVSGKSSELIFPILSWKESSKDFVPALVGQIAEVNQLLGTDAVLYLLKSYVQAGLTRDVLLRGMSENGIEKRIVSSMKGHPHQREAVAFLNQQFDKMDFPLELHLEEDATMPDPFEPDSKQLQNYKKYEKMRYAAGPAVILLGLMTGQMTMSTPVAAATATQIGYELQFANSWMDRHVWSPVFKATGKRRVLGFNPGILVVNALYPLSLYEIMRFTAAVTERELETVLTETSRANAYLGFAVGMVIFSAAYGFYQDDKIIQRTTGRIGEGDRYIDTSRMNIGANGLRMASLFIPFTLASWPISLHELGIEAETVLRLDVGLAGLLTLGLIKALPTRIKTSFGPSARAWYIKLKSQPSSAGSLKLGCARVLEKLTNLSELRVR